MSEFKVGDVGFGVVDNPVNRIWAGTRYSILEVDAKYVRVVEEGLLGDTPTLGIAVATQ